MVRMQIRKAQKVDCIVALAILWSRRTRPWRFTMQGRLSMKRQRIKSIPILDDGLLSLMCGRRTCVKIASQKVPRDSFFVYCCWWWWLMVVSDNRICKRGCRICSDSLYCNSICKCGWFESLTFRMVDRFANAEISIKSSYKWCLDRSQLFLHFVNYCERCVNSNWCNRTPFYYKSAKY